MLAFLFNLFFIFSIYEQQRLKLADRDEKLLVIILHRDSGYGYVRVRGNVPKVSPMCNFFVQYIPI